MYEFRISIVGEKIEVAALRDALAYLLKLFKDVEKGVAAGERVRWRIATLSYSSPVVIGCTGEPKSRKRNAPDNTRLIGNTVASGLAELERGTRPPTFSDDALEVSKHLASLRGQRGIRDIFITEEDGTARDAPLPLSSRIVATVDDHIGVKSESEGSVEGRLEVISVHGGISCNVYEALTGKPIKCEFPAPMRRVVFEAFDQRVIATGTVRRDASGQPRQIALRELAVVPGAKDEFVSLAGIAPDFTDGIDSVQYIKSRWK